MIIDKLDNYLNYCKLGESYEKAFKYLIETNLKDIECGIYEIEGNKIFVSIMEYKTKEQNEALWEAHKKYIDIQYVICGREKMGYANIEKLTTEIEYNSEKDILFGECNGEFLTVEEGNFIIFTPNDGHKPSINVNGCEKVKKAVVKIAID